MKVKTKDEAIAVRIAFALGVKARDGRQEVSAVTGSRKVWASVERPPQVGQRRRALRQAIKWAQVQVPAPDREVDYGSGALLNRAGAVTKAMCWERFAELKAVTAAIPPPQEDETSEPTEASEEPRGPGAQIR